MLVDRVEGKWIDMFARNFALCGAGSVDTVAVLCESQSRAVLVELSELALARLGARVFTVKMPMPPLDSAIALRSTGTRKPHTRRFGAGHLRDGGGARSKAC